MHKTEKESPLKTPIAVFVLGTLFLVAPFGNFLIALFNNNIPEWYWPSTWVEYIPRIALASWIWFGLLLAAGIALLIPRKFSWALAIFVLLYTIVYDLTFPNIPGKVVSYTNWISAGCTASIVIVLFYFRFPYLDRRDRWWGIATRYNTNFQARIEGTKDLVTVLNLSKSGALLRFHDSTRSIEVGEIINCVLPNGNSLSAKVVRTYKKNYGVTFKKLSRKSIRELLKINSSSSKS